MERPPVPEIAWALHEERLRFSPSMFRSKFSHRTCDWGMVKAMPSGPTTEAPEGEACAVPKSPATADALGKLWATS